MKDWSNMVIELSKKNSELEQVLVNILMNTIHRDFGGDIGYKSGVLMNIKTALGEEKYNYYYELYS